MTDLDRQLRESLNSVAQNYRPHDSTAARARFLARRRRRMVGRYAGAALATGTAAVMAFAVFGPQELVPDTDDAPPVAVVGPSVEAHIAGRLPVGDAPSGVGSAGGLLWVANSGDDTVAEVDESTNKVVRVFRVAGGPNDVLVNDGFAWVATARGDVVAIDSETGSRHTFPSTFSPGSHLDLASAGDGGLWVAEGSGRLWRLRIGAKDEAFEYPLPFDDLSDVASDGDDVWAYDRARGEVVQLESGGRGVAARVSVGSSASADLKVTQDFTWVLLGEGGILLQIDKDSGGIVSRHQLGGTFGALAEEGGILYAMVTDGGPNGSGDGRLYRVDAAGETIGDPVRLTKFPYDVEAGPEGIWVTNNSGDTITRIQLVPQSAAPTNDQPAVAAEKLFYFSKDGDIWAYDSGGNIVPVLHFPAFETKPSVSPDGRTLVLQRGSPGASGAEIATYDLASDDSPQVVDRGEAPSYSPRGQIAWTWVERPSNRRMISVGTPGAPQRVDFQADPDPAVDPPVVDNIEWDAEGDTIIFESTFEGTSLLTAEVGPDTKEPRSTVISPPETGAVYLSPAVHPDGTVAVIRLCCSSSIGAGYQVAELGRLEGGAYTKIAGLNDFGLDASIDLWIEAAGHLQYEAETGWSVGTQRSWLVGDGDRLGLITESGEWDEIAISGVSEVAVVSGAME